MSRKWKHHKRSRRNRIAATTVKEAEAIVKVAEVE